MRTIYDIKPIFQRLLQPIVYRLHQRHITPNMVTISAFVLSLVYGIFLAIFPANPYLLLGLPFILFIRMALNAIDGILAKNYQQHSPLGALLNELCDLGSDTALYLPFALVSGINAYLVVLFVILAIIAEAAGLCALLIGALRRYDGPMGKSDRAFAFALIALGLASFNITIVLNWVLIILIGLLLITIFNRSYQALQEI